MNTGADRPIIQRYLSSREAAVYLGLSDPALRKRKQLGEIPFIQVGYWVRYDRFDLDAWLHTHRIGATT